MNVVRIVRSEKDRCAVELRELARRIESGQISYAAIFAMDSNGKVEEIIFEQPEGRQSKTA